MFFIFGRMREGSTSSSIDKPFRDVIVRIDAAIAQEWPPTSYLLTVVQVDVDHNTFFIIIASLVMQFALRSNRERTSPELDAVGLAREVGFESNPVHCDYRQTICYCMSALNGGPGIPLPLLLFLAVTAFIADGCRINPSIGQLQDTTGPSKSKLPDAQQRSRWGGIPSRLV